MVKFSRSKKYVLNGKPKRWHRKKNLPRKSYHQTGKRKSLKADRKRSAKPVGMRKSKSGRWYSETRRNRSDLKGKRI
jgi:hypothetical protein